MKWSGRPVAIWAKAAQERGDLGDQRAYVGRGVAHE